MRRTLVADSVSGEIRLLDFFSSTGGSFFFSTGGTGCRIGRFAAGDGEAVISLSSSSSSEEDDDESLSDEDGGRFFFSSSIGRFFCTGGDGLLLASGGDGRRGSGGGGDRRLVFSCGTMTGFFSGLDEDPDDELDDGWRLCGGAAGNGEPEERRRLMVACPPLRLTT